MLKSEKVKDMLAYNGYILKKKKNTKNMKTIHLFENVINILKTVVVGEFI